MLKRNIADWLVRCANKLCGEKYYGTIYSVNPDNVTVLQYDVNRFDKLTVRTEMTSQRVSEWKKFDFDIQNHINYLLANELGKKILETHKEDVREHTVLAGGLPDKAVFSLELLVSKPIKDIEKNDNR